MQRLTIIDFEKRGHKGILNGILKKCNAKVTDWTARDYGVMLFVEVSDLEAYHLKDLVANNRKHFALDK